MRNSQARIYFDGRCNYILLYESNYGLLWNSKLKTTVKSILDINYLIFEYTANDKCDVIVHFKTVETKNQHCITVLALYHPAL